MTKWTNLFRSRTGLGGTFTLKLSRTYDTEVEADDFKHITPDAGWTWMATLPIEIKDATPTTYADRAYASNAEQRRADQFERTIRDRRIR
jgi:hypothetical protein